MADLLDPPPVRDVVELAWDIRRLRRLKASLLQATAHKGLRQVLTPLLDWADGYGLPEAWARRDGNSIKAVEQLLASADLTMDAVMAETFAAQIGDIQRMEHMIGSAEARLATALREIDRHRAVLAEA